MDAKPAVMCVVAGLAACGGGSSKSGASGGPPAPDAGTITPDVEARWRELLQPLTIAAARTDPYADVQRAEDVREPPPSLSRADAHRWSLTIEPTIAVTATVSAAATDGAPGTAFATANSDAPTATASAVPSHPAPPALARPDESATPAGGDGPRTAESQFRCVAAFGIENAPCPIFTGSEPATLSPEWIKDIVANTAGRACGDLRLPDHCEPLVRMSGDVGDAMCCVGADQVIWYNYANLQKQRSLVPDELGFRTFVHGVLAHEYGHHVDAALAKWRNYYLQVPELRDDPALAPQNDSTGAWKRELFADSVAGCVLSKLRMSLDPVATVFVRGVFAGGSNTHPPGAIRLVALQDGAKRCGGTPLAESILAQFR